VHACAVPKEAPKGLPGGVALPAVVFLASMTLFIVAWRDPELIDLGPHIRPAGVGVLVAAASFFWLLAAIGKRPPRPHR
jgi:hypothetical protein